MRATISWLALTPLLYPPVPTPSGSPTCEPVSIAPIRCIRHHGRRSYQASPSTDWPHGRDTRTSMSLVVQASLWCPGSGTKGVRHGHPSRGSPWRVFAAWRAERPIAGRPKAPRSIRERAPVGAGISLSLLYPRGLHASSLERPCAPARPRRQASGGAGRSGTPEHGCTSTRGGRP
jgi:hypothetical protein